MTPYAKLPWGVSGCRWQNGTFPLRVKGVDLTIAFTGLVVEPFRTWWLAFDAAVRDAGLISQKSATDNAY